MKVTVVGSGYVGLVTATCLAGSGNHVVGVDIDADKVRRLNAGECTIYEPGLAELLKANLSAGRLRFSTDLSEGVTHGEVIFIAVGTPPDRDGSADLSTVESIVREVARHMTRSLVVAIKSTVPVGTNRAMSALLDELTAHPFAVVSNPEFLKEGAAVEDFLRPDRVIVGCRDQEAAGVMRELYAPYVHTPAAIMRMTPEAAEMVKYASNAYLATRISFINEIADICARADVDINEVRAGMGADRRIGMDFLMPGIGFGGSCFPKDVLALIQVAKNLDSGAAILQSVYDVNERHKRALADMVLGRFDNDVSGKTFAVWGLAFKPDTDDVRDAPAMRVIQLLAQAGARLNCYDPQACANAAREMTGAADVRFFNDPYQPLQGADALIICTAWNEFRSPDFDRIRSSLARRIIFDGRNLYERADMQRQRFEYYSIGRPAVDNAKNYRKAGS